MIIDGRMVLSVLASRFDIQPEIDKYWLDKLAETLSPEVTLRLKEHIVPGYPSAEPLDSKRILLDIYAQFFLEAPDFIDHNMLINILLNLIACSIHAEYNQKGGYLPFQKLDMPSPSQCVEEFNSPSLLTWVFVAFACRDDASVISNIIKTGQKWLFNRQFRRYFDSELAVLTLIFNITSVSFPRHMVANDKKIFWFTVLGQYANLGHICYRRGRDALDRMVLLKALHSLQKFNQLDEAENLRKAMIKENFKVYLLDEFKQLATDCDVEDRHEKMQHIMVGFLVLFRGKQHLKENVSFIFELTRSYVLSMPDLQPLNETQPEAAFYWAGKAKNLHIENAPIAGSLHRFFEEGFVYERYDLLYKFILPIATRSELQAFDCILERAWQTNRINQGDYTEMKNALNQHPRFKQPQNIPTLGLASIGMFPGVSPALQQSSETTEYNLFG